MYKIIACDLDETLLRTDRTLSPRDVEAVRRARELGVKFVPATGRGYNTVGGTLEQLGLWDQENEYVISYNGGAITENKGSRLLHFQGLPFPLAEELYRRGRKYDVCIHVYTRDMVYAFRLWQKELDYLAGRMEIKEVFEDDLSFLSGQEIAKVLYVNTDYAYLKRIEADLADITRDIDVSYSSNRYIEFNSAGVSKGAGLLSLAKLLGVKREETIAIGDNFNDLSMIRAAGLGAGVRNAAEGLKPLCGYVTRATNDEGAVAEVIEKFVLAPQSL